MKENERRKRKSEEEERRRGEKSNGCTISFYNGYFGDSQLVLGEKKLLDATFRGNPLKYPAKYTYVIILVNQIKTLFTWSEGPRSSGISFFCFVSSRA